jgi:hypothetical protein
MKRSQLRRLASLNLQLTELTLASMLKLMLNPKEASLVVLMLPKKKKIKLQRQLIR